MCACQEYGLNYHISIFKLYRDNYVLTVLNQTSCFLLTCLILIIPDPEFKKLISLIHFTSHDLTLNVYRLKMCMSPILPLLKNQEN